MVKHDRGIQIRNVAVATMNMSIAAVSARWLCGKLREVGEGVLGRRGRYLPSGLADIDAELEQFAMDARRAPERVGGAHRPIRSRISAFVLGRPEPRDRSRQ
jgi:hypothetical protein